MFRPSRYRLHSNVPKLAPRNSTPQMRFSSDYFLSLMESPRLKSQIAITAEIIEIESAGIHRDIA